MAALLSRRLVGPISRVVATAAMFIPVLFRVWGLKYRGLRQHFVVCGLWSVV